MPHTVIVEPSPIADIFVTSIANLEVLGSCARFTMYVDRTPPGSNTIEREIVARFIIPLENIPAAIAFTVAQLGGHWVTRPVVPRHIHPTH